MSTYQSPRKSIREWVKANRDEIIVSALVAAPVALFVSAAVVLGATSAAHPAPPTRATTAPSAPAPPHAQNAWDRFWSWTPPPTPTSVVCTFKGEAVSCVKQWAGKPPTTQVLPWPLTEDQQTQLIDDGANWPPKTEPGREQYLTPLELDADSFEKPLAPTRHCRDGLMQPAFVCDDLSWGTVSWVHDDGTVVLVNPDPAVWPKDDPTPRRCPGSDLWVPYVPTCPGGVS